MRRGLADSRRRRCTELARARALGGARTDPRRLCPRRIGDRLRGRAACAGIALGPCAKLRAMALKTVHRQCNLCEAHCGITVEVDGAKVLRITGDKDDPTSKGYICPKAAA